METDYSGRAPRSSPISLSSLPSPMPALHSTLSLPMSPSPPSASAQAASRRLDLLLREQAMLSSMKASIPHSWAVLEAEIMRLRTHHSDTAPSQRLASHLLPPMHAPPTPSQSGGGGGGGSGAQSLSGSRKRIKLRVPDEKYPDYNFVGRLLGPRGATLKKLERDTGCKIMIRGRGSIRKDKESEVRGKPGWEHVFNENLHVVIEVSDFHDESDANRILTRAREMVELLLVPVPEERDTLKRQQLRDLAILNGTFRATDATPPSGSHSVSYQPSSSPAAGAHVPRGASARDYAASHTSTSNFDYPSFSTTDSLLARRRAAALQGNVTQVPNNFDMGGVSHSHAASSPSLARHGGPAAMAAAAAAAAAAGVDTDGAYVRANHTSQHQHSKLKPSLPSRSDSYLPDIGALRIPSLDIETMSESFLVSPMAVVDETYYPFPSTPGVHMTDRGTVFGSPIWSGAPASSPIAGLASPRRSPPSEEAPMQPPIPLRSPSLGGTQPLRSPPDEGATDHTPSLRVDTSGNEYPRAKVPFSPTAPHPRAIDAAAALARELPARAAVFETVMNSASGDKSVGASASGTSFPSLLPKVSSGASAAETGRVNDSGR